MDPAFIAVLIAVMVVCMASAGVFRSRHLRQQQGGRPMLQAPTRIAQDLTPQARQAIAEEIAAGRKINAIKLYREATRVGLKEAKDAVELWESQGTALPTSGVIDSPAIEGQNPYGPLPGGSAGTSGNGDGGSQDQWPQLPPTNRS